MTRRRAHAPLAGPAPAVLVALLAACSRAPDAPGADGAAARPPAAPVAVTGAPAGAGTAGTDMAPPPGAASAGWPDVPAVEDQVRADDTLASLRARHGQAEVVATGIPGAEGEVSQGWVLFPSQPTRRLEVHLGPDGRPMLVIAGEDVSAWRRRDGVRIGLNTRELEALNGRPFEFLGFDWDYGGTVSDWKGGRLGPGDMGAGPVRLCRGEASDAEADYPMGDVPVMSDDPRILQSPAAVCEFGVRLAPPG